MLSKLQGVSEIVFYTGEEVPPESEHEFIWLSFQEEVDLRGFLPLMNLACDDVFISASDNIGQVSSRYPVVIIFS